MAVITMRIPRLDRAIRSVVAAAQAPVKAIGNPAVAICAAVGKSLSAATRIHLPTRRFNTGARR